VGFGDKDGVDVGVVCISVVELVERVCSSVIVGVSDGSF
jgi:hypothetical protein